jgi:hypothetical protein
VLASDLLDGKWAMLWNDEQQGIRELMTERQSRTSRIVHGHAPFTVTMTRPSLRGWSALPRTCSGLPLRFYQRSSVAPAVGVVRTRAATDEEGTYGGVWIDRSASEIGQRAQHGLSTHHEKTSRCDRTFDRPLTMEISSTDLVPQR